MASGVFLGLDFGTSGARACVMAASGEVEDLARIDFGRLEGDEAAARWREALFELISQVPLGLRKRLAAVAIDGTSASVLACDAELRPLHAPLMYDDARAAVEAGVIGQRVAEYLAPTASPTPSFPRRRESSGSLALASAEGSGENPDLPGNDPRVDHPAASATSGLAKAMWLLARVDERRLALYLNQADWLAAVLGGRPASDTHNALKMGLDPVTNQWPAWLQGLLPGHTLPRPVRPGETLGLIERSHATAFTLPSDCLLRAGTTDSIAAFLAAGVHQPGEAVTSLGTTLVLKLLSEQRVDAGDYGIYSHWFGRLWLTGGASNSGGGVLLQFFSDEELLQRSALIDPSRDSGLDYYPLRQPGERFPIHDPHLPPRLTPQPADRTAFLHALLEGVARIEALGYRRLAELGASPLARVVSCGGGARNPQFSRLRERLLGVPVAQATLDEACYGSARLACWGTGLFPAEQT